MDFIKDQLMKLSDKTWQEQIRTVMTVMLIGSVIGWITGWKAFSALGPFLMLLSIIACVYANNAYNDKAAS